MISTSPSEHSVSTQNDDIESINNENNTLKIFIGGLNYITLKDDLKCYFKTFGHVSKCVVIINEKGRSKCYGFITFEDTGTFLFNF
jgi:RNA recognition motif-containing protein